MKRIFSIVLILTMFLGLMPVGVSAESNEVTFTDTMINNKATITIAVSGADVASSEYNAGANTLNITVKNPTGTNITLKATSNLNVYQNSQSVNISSGSGSVDFRFFTQHPNMGETVKVNITVAGGFGLDTNLNENEVKYTVGSTAEALKVKASSDDGVTYQWYSNTTKSTESGTAMLNATSESYIPATDTVGTTYYYVVVSSGETTVTSKIAKITVEAPIVKFNTNLIESETKYTLGKPASSLTVSAEYTGITENAVTYQWYSYTDNIENAAAIEGATSYSYTPATTELGTTYYYVVASCEGLEITSNIAIISVIELPPLDVVDNVIDIADKTVYSYSKYYANVTNIRISGATVERATQDGTTVDIVL